MIFQEMLQRSRTQSTGKSVIKQRKRYNYFKYKDQKKYGEGRADLPGAAKIIGALDEQGGRSERLERHDQMGKMELGLQVQLDANILLTVL